MVVLRKQKQKLKETEHFLASRLSFFAISDFSSNSSLQVRFRTDCRLQNRALQGDKVLEPGTVRP